MVFGAGPRTARVMFVGEQPGDQEDRQGEPFVGPAGALLDKALADAGIPRDEVYLTNAVKHFKWEPRGKRRIHKKPRMSEIKACRPWLEAEMRADQAGGRGLPRRDSGAVGARIPVQADAVAGACCPARSPNGWSRRSILRRCCARPIPKGVEPRTTCSSRICASCGGFLPEHDRSLGDGVAGGDVDRSLHDERLILSASFQLDIRSADGSR